MPAASGAFSPSACPASPLPWARRTRRLDARLTAFGLALGGSAGVRLSAKLGLAASRNTLLRLVRQAPLPPAVTPSVLGVDDWALRKRHSYGTVLVDLERRRPVALLPDREADTLAAWLREHPGVAVVARDRAGAYAEGARSGAPEAVQVADRFHLLQNLAEALEVVFTIHAKHLRAVDQARREAVGPERHISFSRPPRRRNESGSWPLRATSGARPGTSRCGRSTARAGHGRGSARSLGLSRSTVYRCLRSEAFPERRRRRDAGHSRLDPWRSVVLEHWNDGRRNGRTLFRDLQRRGYRGSYATLTRYLRRFRALPEECGAGQIPAGAGRGCAAPGANAAQRGLDGAAPGGEAERTGQGSAGRSAPVRSRVGRGGHARRGSSSAWSATARPSVSIPG